MDPPRGGRGVWTSFSLHGKWLTVGKGQIGEQDNDNNFREGSILLLKLKQSPPIRFDYCLFWNITKKKRTPRPT